jgi:hypothetical protein
MSLKAQITEDMKTAMRAKDSARLGTIRLLQAAMKQKEVDERVELDDAAIIAIVDKLIKQRKDSIAAFESANRQDLADVEKAEVEVLKVYLPERMGEAESPPPWPPSWPSRCHRPRRHGQGHGRRQVPAGRQGRYGTGVGRREGCADSKRRALGEPWKKALRALLCLQHSYSQLLIR